MEFLNRFLYRFQEINGKLAKFLRVSLNRGAIKNMVMDETECQKLKDMLSYKYFYLKMDACTQHRVNYFTTNVQFVEGNNKITIDSLAVRCTYHNHKSGFINDLIKQIIKF